MLRREVRVCFPEAGFEGGQRNEKFMVTHGEKRLTV